MPPRIADILSRSLDQPIDVSDEVMAAIALDEAFAATREVLRRELVDPGPDVAGDVMAALDALPDPFAADRPAMEVAAFADGEVRDEVRIEVSRRLMRDAGARAAIRAQAELAAALRGALTERRVDAWPAVARGIGLDAVEAHWEETADALRAALAGTSVDVADDVMRSLEGAPAEPLTAANTLPPALASRSRWQLFAGPIFGFAAAAAAMFALIPDRTEGPPAGGVAQVEAPTFELGGVNDAQVEEIAYAVGVVGTVIAPQDAGDVMVIVVDDSALIDSAGTTL